MSIAASFFGGPWHGQLREIEAAIPVYELAVWGCPPKLFVQDAPLPSPPRVTRYRLRHVDELGEARCARYVHESVAVNPGVN